MRCFSSRPSTSEFNAEVIHDVSRRLSADIVLYDFAAQLHSEQVDKFTDFDARTKSWLKACSDLDHPVSSHCTDAVEKKSSRFREGNFGDGKSKCIFSKRLT